MRFNESFRKPFPQKPDEKLRKKYENRDCKRYAETRGNNGNNVHKIDFKLFRKPFLKFSRVFIVVAVHGGGTHKRFCSADQRQNEINYSAQERYFTGSRQMFSSVQSFGFYLNFSVGVAHGRRHTRSAHHHYAFEHCLSADVGAIFFALLFFSLHRIIYINLSNYIY